MRWLGCLRLRYGGSAGEQKDEESLTYAALYGTHAAHFTSVESLCKQNFFAGNLDSTDGVFGSSR